ncbi:hypothetical protein AWR27_17115 [Spirosoma montaniterrae]|uniref:Uncharacterized protein n=1 Tax=Spirosoma montaniterrae TaxID=1178516 RepID=A0A1P9WZW6_9BACT|nr:hypothetical protein AWR27_17115 [Spirosoma montaniterrae]
MPILRFRCNYCFCNNIEKRTKVVFQTIITTIGFEPAPVAQPSARVVLFRGGFPEVSGVFRYFAVGKDARLTGW